MSQVSTTAALLSQSSDLAVVRRSGPPLDLVSIIEIDQPLVLPPHSAETLSRALSAVPVYARYHSVLGVETVLSEAAAIVSDTRATLHHSVSVASQLGTALLSLSGELALQRISSPGANAMTKDIATMVQAVQSVTRAVKGNAYRLLKVVQELDKEMGLVSCADAATQRWKTAIRIGSVSISVPSFATAIVSAVYNTTSPRIALIMALVSASTGICAAVGPCIAQGALLSQPARLDGTTLTVAQLKGCWGRRNPAPYQANLQNSHIEVFRMQYPLELVLQWWRQLDIKVRSLVESATEPLVAARLCKSVITQVTAYAGEASRRVLAVPAH